MDWDDVRPKPAAAALAIGQDLSSLGIAELEQRIDALKNEIARIEQELARKRAHEAAASALFKS